MRKRFFSSSVVFLGVVALTACDKSSGAFTSLPTSDQTSNALSPGSAEVTPSSLATSFAKSPVALGELGDLITTIKNISNVTYECSNGQSGAITFGDDNVNNLRFPAVADLSCSVSGVDPAGRVVTQTANLTISCSGNLVKSGGVCVPYSCQSFVAIDPSISDIPARTSAGVCYYMKLFNEVAGGRSSGTRLANVLSRDHDASADSVNHPYILGRSQIQINLAGERTIKLSGNSHALAPILVDNYILLGTRLASQGPSQTKYSAFGTADSVIKATNTIQVNNSDVQLKMFESGGTATIEALTLTDQFEVGETNFLSVDALDCGGWKQLSEIYLVFQ